MYIYIVIIVTTQDKQCTYNITLRCVRATIVVDEQQYYKTCVCISAVTFCLSLPK